MIEQVCFDKGSFQKRSLFGFCVCFYNKGDEALAQDAQRGMAAPSLETFGVRLGGAPGAPWRWPSLHGIQNRWPLGLPPN